jgi:hypothetical protein
MPRSIVLLSAIVVVVKLFVVFCVVVAARWTADTVVVAEIRSRDLEAKKQKIIIAVNTN